MYVRVQVCIFCKLVAMTVKADNKIRKINIYLPAMLYIMVVMTKLFYKVLDISKVAAFAYYLLCFICYVGLFKHECVTLNLTGLI